MATATTSCSRITLPAVSLPFSARAREPFCYAPCNTKPNFRCLCLFKIPRIKISSGKIRELNQVFGLPFIDAVVDDSPEIHSQSELSSNISNGSSKEAAINIKLPRRSLLVEFTCNACGVRSQRLVNRLAIERGTVFVQCSGCLQHHKLVDNLGLVIEYDLREEACLEANED